MDVQSPAGKQLNEAVLADQPPDPKTTSDALKQAYADWLRAGKP
jgi:hypothetical protein